MADDDKTTATNQDDHGGGSGAGDQGGGDGADKAKSKPDTGYEVKFRTKAEFHSEVDRKVKSAVSRAVEEAQGAFLSKLGIDAIDDLDGVVEKVKTAKAALTETDKLKADIAKLAKEHGKISEQAKSLRSWKDSALKQRAITAFASRVVDLETLTALLEPKIAIREDDSVTGPDGRSLEDVVDELIKSKPFLKVPDYKAGAGTSPTATKPAQADKPAADSKAKPADGPNGANTFKSTADAFRFALQQQQKDAGGKGP